MKEKLFVLLGLTALAFIAYRDCFDILIPADNYTQFYYFDKGFVAGFQESAKGSSAYFSGWPFLYLLYKLLSVSAAGWVSTCLFLHTLNAFFVFLIAQQLIKTFSSAPKLFPTVLASILFLISPYQTEAVLWGTVSARWLFHSFAALAGIYLFLIYLKSPSPGKLISMQILFLLALFSNETALALPLTYSVLFFLYARSNKTTIPASAFLVRMIALQGLFVLVFFILNKLYMGSWLWHGGTMEQVTASSEYIKTLLKYFAKFFLLYRYLPYELWDGFLRTVSSSYFMILAFFMGLVFILFYFFRKAVRSKKETGNMAGALFLCFVISLLPVLPLDSSFLNNIYPDRYGYFASVFFYLFISLGLFFLTEKFSGIILAAYGVLCLFLLSNTLAKWESTNEYCNSLIRSYAPFLPYEHVYVLNEPTYYQGVIAFRYDTRAAMYYAHSHSPVDKIRIVSGCYQESIHDSLVSVKRMGNKVEVKGPEKNTPHFSTGGWAKSYQTNEYSVTFDPTGCAYVLEFEKGIPPNSAFIYTLNGKWAMAN
jgi:hypothetical protein